MQRILSESDVRAIVREEIEAHEARKSAAFVRSIGDGMDRLIARSIEDLRDPGAMSRRAEAGVAARRAHAESRQPPATDA